MRIALVVPGGVDRSAQYRVIPALLALIGRLAARHELEVFALRQEPQPGSWELAGARIHNIGEHRTRWRAVGAILKAHRRSPFDVVQSIFSGSSGSIAVTAARLMRRPCLVHVAGGEPVRCAEIGYGGRLHLTGRAQEWLTLRSATLVTAASTPLIAMLADLGCRAERVPLGVDRRCWPDEPPRRRGVHEPLRLVHVASLNRVKDQPLLLRALTALERLGVDFQMQVVGEDTLGGEVQCLAARLGLDTRVRFLGFLPQSELRAWVRAAHLLILSSRHEAGPLAMLEAAMVGVPTVGTAVGHVAEWAPEAALAVASREPLGLAVAIQRLALDEELRLRLAAAAHRRAVREDADYTVRCFLERYARWVRVA